MKPAHPTFSLKPGVYQPIDGSDLDAFAREAAQRWADNEITYDDAATRIFDAIIRSGLVTQSVIAYRKYLATGDRCRTEELIADVAVVLFTYIHPSGGKHIFDLNKVLAGTSTQGWARSMCRTIIYRKNRDEQAKRDLRRTQTADIHSALSGENTSSNDPYVDRVFSAKPLAFVGGSTRGRQVGMTCGVHDDDTLSGGKLVVSDVFTDKINAFHGTRKIFGFGALIRYLFNLPKAVAPHGFDERQELMRVFADNEDLAFQSARDTLRARQGDDVELSCRVQSLWDDFDDVALDYLIHLPEALNVADSLVREAICAKPRPSKQRIRSVIKDIQERLTDATHKAEVPGFIESYLAYHYETTSDYVNISPDQKAELEGAAQIMREDYLKRAEDVARWDDLDLGTTPDEVSEALHAYLAPSCDEELAALHRDLVSGDAV